MLNATLNPGTFMINRHYSANIRRPLILHMPLHLSSRVSTRCNAATSLCSKPPSKRAHVFHEIEFKVRDYELDKYGVVNNATYASYCEHGHHEILEQVGIHPNEIIRNDCLLALSQISLNFIAPLRSGDRFVLKMKLQHISSTRLYFDHFIFKLPNLEPIVEVKATGVWLDKNYRPVRVPQDVRSKFCQFFQIEQL